MKSSDQIVTAAVTARSRRTLRTRRVFGTRDAAKESKAEQARRKVTDMILVCHRVVALLSLCSRRRQSDQSGVKKIDHLVR